MSGSYKKTPVFKDHTTGMKTIANRKVRRRLKSGIFEPANGNGYRKFVCSYDISDWAFLAINVVQFDGRQNKEKSF